jgi:hypothetical protein
MPARAVGGVRAADAARRASPHASRAPPQTRSAPVDRDVPGAGVELTATLRAHALDLVQRDDATVARRHFEKNARRFLPSRAARAQLADVILKIAVALPASKRRSSTPGASSARVMNSWNEPGTGSAGR